MKEKGTKKEADHRDYWEFAKKVVDEVAGWPDWKKNTEIGYSYSTNSDLSLSGCANEKWEPVRYRPYDGWIFVWRKSFDGGQGFYCESTFSRTREGSIEIYFGNLARGDKRTNRLRSLRRRGCQFIKVRSRRTEEF